MAWTQTVAEELSSSQMWDTSGRWSQETTLGLEMGMRKESHEGLA